MLFKTSKLEPGCLNALKSLHHNYNYNYSFAITGMSPTENCIMNREIKHNSCNNRPPLTVSTTYSTFDH